MFKFIIILTLAGALPNFLNGGPKTVEDYQLQTNLMDLQTDSLKRKIAHIDSLRTRRSALQAQKDELDKPTTGLGEQYNHILKLQADSLTDLDAKIARYASIRKEMSAHNGIKADSKPAAPAGFDFNQLYSAITPEALNQYEKTTKDKAEREKITTARGIRGIYDRMEQALNSPYDAKKIEKVRRDFLGHKPGTAQMDSAQWKEIRKLEVSLSRYNKGVTNFKGVISGSDEVIKASAGKSDAEVADSIQRQVLDPAQEDIDRRIMVVPYLKTRYEQYANWLKSTPMKPTPPEIEAIKKEILKIKN